MHKLLKTCWFYLFLGLASGGCGDVKLGPAATPNDPAPSGIVVAQGDFQSLNGHSVTGSVSVYRDDNTYYIVRLEGINAPDETGLILTAKANGSPDFTAQLRNHLGTQNYATGMSGLLTWTSVTISKSRVDYGKANLTAP